VIERLRRSDEWEFFTVLPQAGRSLAVLWWVILGLRGLLPAVFAVAMGVLVGAVHSGDSLIGPLALMGAVFVLLQTLMPLHQAVSANLGSKTAAWLYDRLMEVCIRPPGIGHLEQPALTDDLTMARDFDLGISGPPLPISMDFIAGGLVMMLSGIAQAAVLLRYRWWAPVLIGGAWAATHVVTVQSRVADIGSSGLYAL
jgi:ATP-binding cassette, subfamily B, bacterial